MSMLFQKKTSRSRNVSFISDLVFRESIKFVLKITKIVRKRVLFCFLVFPFVGLPVQTVQAREQAFEIDYTEIEAVLEEIGIEESGSFEELVLRLLHGDYSMTELKERLFGEGMGFWKEERTQLLRLFTIAIAAAVFTNFTKSLKQGQAAETGFFISYMLIAIGMLSIFTASKTVAELVLGQILSFMRVLLPAYCVGIAFTTGSMSAAAFYEGSLLAVTAAEMLMQHVILPLIHLYFLLSLVTYMVKEDFLSRCAGFCSQAAAFLMKTMVAFVVGIGTIQGMLTPAADELKRSVLMKTAGALPGVGNLLTGVTQTVLSAGVLLRNTVGIAGAIFLIFIAVFPLIRLGLLAVFYYAGAALLQPVSDKRMLACFSAAGRTHVLLVQMVFYTVLLFLLTILLVAAALGLT